MPAGGGQPVVQHGPAHVPPGGRLPGRPDRVPEQHAQLLHGPLGPEPARRLVAVGPVDGDARRVDRRHPVHDPVREHAAHPAAGQDAQRVQARGHEVAVQLGSGPEQRPHVGGERLRPAEEGPHARIRQHGNPVQRRAEEGLHPLPVRTYFPKRKPAGHPVERPRGGDRLEEAHQHAVALGPVVAVVVRVLDDRQIGVHPRHRVGEQVVMLSGLEGDGDPGQGPELAGPHARRVDHHLGLDPAGAGQHGAHLPPAGRHPGRGHPFDDPDAQLAGALGQRRGHAHRVGPALVGDVEGGEHVVGAGQRPQIGQLARRDLGVLDPEASIQAASRRSASCRRGVVAREMCPTGRNPVECPVSCSSRAYRSRE